MQLVILLLILILTLFSPLFGQERAAAKKGELTNEEIISGTVAKMNRGEWRLAAEDFAVDTLNHGEKGGREAIREVLADIFTTFPDWRMEILEMFAAGEYVSVRLQVSGTHRGTGKIPVNGGMLVGVAPTNKRFEVQHIHLFKLRGGKIVDHYANRDDLGMMQQLGLLPSNPPVKN